MELGENGKYSIRVLLNPDKFLNSSFDNFFTLKAFSDAFFETLNKLVKERLEPITEIGFGADISSGFDSTLINYLLKKNSKKDFISYCEIAKAGIKDTDPDIVVEFAKKHKLNIKFVPYDDFFPFSTENDLELIKKEPSHIQKSQLDFYLKHIRQDGNLIRFTGEGGDEAYWSHNEILDLRLKFPKQMQFFQHHSLRRYGIDKILTEKGISFLLDKERFRGKKFFPLFIPHSVVNLFIMSFHLHWMNEVWPITPFVDTRIIQIARGIPSKGIDKVRLKQKIWEGRKDIFVEGIFREKGGTEEHYGRFLLEKGEFIISLLKNSQLGHKNWVRSSEIIKNLLNGKLESYYRGDVMAYLTNLLELEYFIQQNNINVL